jgi:hypothetical protein
MGKVCSKCKIEKDESEFGKNSRMKDGLHYVCKECKHKQDNAWVAKHNEEHKQRARNWRKNNPDKIREQYQKRKEYLLSLKTPCIKCGESRPTVIEFHHIDPSTKLFNLAYTVSNGSKPREIIEAELKKCVCLCANCHAEFHEKYGQKPDEPEEALNEYINL